jgi:DNA-directed RNA polymerase specialized sigma subunit
VNKAKELLDELQNLDLDIQSRIDEINELEAGLLSSPKWTADKVKGGQAKKVDDVYTQLIVMKEAIEQDTNEVINRKLELGRLINKLKDPKHRTILRMTYISKKHIIDICDALDGISPQTYYRLRKSAIFELDMLLCESH